MKKISKSNIYLLIISILILFLIIFCFPIYRVASNSMKPSINRGDQVLVSRFYYKFFEPSKNDVVLFNPVNGIFEKGVWIHRVIATKGDLVSIKDGSVTVNENSALFPDINNRDLDLKIENNFIFQKGDYMRTISGVVSEKEIIGKVVFVLPKVDLFSIMKLEK